MYAYAVVIYSKGISTHVETFAHLMTFSSAVVCVCVCVWREENDQN